MKLYYVIKHIETAPSNERLIFIACTFTQILAIKELFIKACLMNFYWDSFQVLFNKQNHIRY